MANWIIEVNRLGIGFVTAGLGPYSDAQKAKIAASRTFKSTIFTRTVRVVNDELRIIHQGVLTPGAKAKWERIQ